VEALGAGIEIVAYVLFAAVILRAISSWFNFDQSSSVYHVLYQITEPILAPIRSIMPRLAIDLSPMVAGFILIFLAQLGASLRN
jgi:YggT family protein